MAVSDAYKATMEDVQRLAELAGMGFVDDDAEDGPTETSENDGPACGPDSVKLLLQEMAHAACSTTKDDERFFHFWCNNSERIRAAAQVTPEVAEMLLLGFKTAILNDSARSMNCLGALYYLGDILEQDYAKAADLYEMAMDAGCYQSIINLGYIYEYGRIGEPDHAKAYQYYALAAALAPSFEAAYKLGDMYSRGKAVPRDMRKAHALYARSLQLAETDVEIAQPAIRLAKMLIDPEGPSYGVEPDPLEALSFFQIAEIGLRKDIADGQYYYTKRLAEALAGQEAARAML